MHRTSQAPTFHYFSGCKSSSSLPFAPALIISCPYCMWSGLSNRSKTRPHRCLLKSCSVLQSLHSLRVCVDRFLSPCYLPKIHVQFSQSSATLPMIECRCAYGQRSRSQGDNGHSPLQSIGTCLINSLGLGGDTRPIRQIHEPCPYNSSYVLATCVGEIGSLDISWHCCTTTP